MKLRILIAGLIVGVAALAADSGAELFQKAVTQERAAGNLEEAIKLYQRVAKEFASDRALAAKALVQEARCYEKLGQDKAVKVYEQVARDFSDQHEFAATASARLAALKQVDHAAPATMTQRKIDLPHPSNSFQSFYQTDGQRTIYKDDATGAMILSDLGGNDKRVIFKPKAGALDFLMPSRDFSTVLMGLTRPDGSHTTAVIKTDGTGYRDSGIDQARDPEWSWDNRYVLCETQRDGSRQVLRFSVADGEVRRLRIPEGVHRFSPDGNFIASTRFSNLSGEILVVPSQGGEPQMVSGSGRLIDWTRDGRYLVIGNDRSGSDALYLLPIKDGKRAGDPVFVRYGSFEEGRTAASGSLVYRALSPAGGFTSWLGRLDSDGRVEGWEQMGLGGSSRIVPMTMWSPDSRQIAYETANHAAGQDTWFVRLHNIAGGEERELYQGGAGPAVCVWATQHPNLFCAQLTTRNTTDLLSISTDSGSVERLGSIAGLRGIAAPSHDDRAIYLITPVYDIELVRWEIGTQQATTIERSRGLPYSPGVVSKDERRITRWEKGKIEIRPMSGGDWKPLVSSEETRSIALTADGSWLLYNAADAAGKQSLFRVSTTGGQPERLGDFPGTTGNLFISPDGRLTGQS